MLYYLSEDDTESKLQNMRDLELKARKFKREKRRVQKNSNVKEKSINFTPMMIHNPSEVLFEFIDEDLAETMVISDNYSLNDRTVLILEQHPKKSKIY